MISLWLETYVIGCGNNIFEGGLWDGILSRGEVFFMGAGREFNFAHDALITLYVSRTMLDSRY